MANIALEIQKKATDISAKIAAAVEEKTGTLPSIVMKGSRIQTKDGVAEGTYNIEFRNAGEFNPDDLMTNSEFSENITSVSPMADGTFEVVINVMGVGEKCVKKEALSNSVDLVVYPMPKGGTVEGYKALADDIIAQSKTDDMGWEGECRYGDMNTTTFIKAAEKCSYCGMFEGTAVVFCFEEAVDRFVFFGDYIEDSSLVELVSALPLTGEAEF